MANTTLPAVALLGSGNLGTAIASGIAEANSKANPRFGRLIITVGTESSKKCVEDTLSAQSSNVTVLLKEDNLKAIQDADVVIFAIKPVKRSEILGLAGVTDALKGKLIISIMAGISTTVLIREVTGNSAPSANDQPPQIVRAMPNMAAKIREAMTLFTAQKESLTKENQELTSWIFNQVGQSQMIDEGNFDISAVLVGCAGSLLLLAVDGLLDAAVAEGVRRSEATEMVMQSALGMMKLVPAGDHPSVLREKIASPGGCSIRALLELEKLGVRSAFTTAIMAAAEKSKSLSK